MLNVESADSLKTSFSGFAVTTPELRLELTARKEIIVMSPTNSKTRMRNAEINRQPGNWAKRDGRGVI